MPEKIMLKVNGKSHSVETDPDTPLLYVLRNNLELNGPKYGCGIERCGNCMVLLDGEAMPSCMVKIDAVKGRSINTLESLGTYEKPDPIQKAFIEEQAAQCGYCMNGMIISAKSLLSKNKNPSDLEIREALQRVICRCGTHTRVIAAVKRAAAQMK